MELRRAESLNDQPLFLRALGASASSECVSRSRSLTLHSAAADIAHQHLQSLSPSADANGARNAAYPFAQCVRMCRAQMNVQC